MDALEARYSEVKKLIHSHVTLVAASKTQSIEAIQALYRLGQRDFGENYVQELSEKARQLHQLGLTDIRWHFIGHLQRNKVKDLFPWTHAVHSVDSLRIAEELARRFDGTSPLPIFVEVNLDAEDTKNGVPSGECRQLCEKIAAFSNLDLQGLMCIPALASPSPFTHLRELERTCRPFTRGGLSMGMSEDFAQAIAAGATHVRVGTALFGPRAVRPPGA